MDKTELRPDHFFEMKLVNNDVELMAKVVNQGIDSRLTAFTRSKFHGNHYNQLFCLIHSDEMEILIRRLLELETENAENLADSIVEVYYGKETI